MGDLDVRAFEPADADRVRRIHEAALRASPLPYDPDAPDDDAFREIEDRYAQPDRTLLVGELSGTVVALGGIQRIDDVTAEIKHMRVHPDHQGNGYGCEMLGELEERCVTEGYETIQLVTNQNLTVARRIYEGHGYEETDQNFVPEAGAAFLSYRKPL